MSLTFLGLTCINFIIGRAIPIDPVTAIVGEKATRSTCERVFKELSLDRPIYEQYWIYLSKILHGDFGKSLLTARPVLSDLLRFFPATVELSLPSLIFGVCLGVVAATHRGRWPTKIVRFGLLLGYSLPVFWLGIFYAKLVGWVEGPGRVDFAFAEQLRLDARAGSAHPVDPRARSRSCASPGSARPATH